MEQPNIATPLDSTAVSEQSEQRASARLGGNGGHAAPFSDRARRRTKQGRVVSNKMEKTIVVVTETRVPHPVYKKVVRISKRFKAHDEKSEAQIGDLVRIAECRPLSKDKRWRLTEIVERAK